VVSAAEADDDPMGDLRKDGNLSDVLGMGCLQFE
jgi:hypothetical protein